MKHSIPIEIQNILDNYIKLLVSEFGDDIYGVYIYGSLASGNYDVESSDIDFMTILDKELNDDDVKCIQSIHNKLEKMSAYGQMFEGEYVALSDIKNGMPSKQYPYFAFGKFQGRVYLKNFAWFQLKERGITYYGNDFCNIAGSIDWKDVRSELLDRLNTYWPAVVNWKLLVFDRWLALVVLSVCRVYYSLENKSTISKYSGGEYALSKLSEEWHPLIREALRIQEKSSTMSQFNSKFKRLKNTRDFVKHISKVCNMQY